jgi:NAD(P)-dependent dehydrogenase (short-subunit alcohol dehydrogenase family)
VTSLCSTAEGAQKNAQIRNADADAVAVIVGGSRGIGLAMVQVLTTSFKGRIFATGRRPQDATALKKKKSVCRMLPRKDGSRRRGHEGEREGQDLNNRTCCHNVDLCIRAQTFMLRTRPSPPCALTA